MGRKGKDGWSGLGARIVRYVWSGSVLRRGWTGIVDTGGVDHRGSTTGERGQIIIRRLARRWLMRSQAPCGSSSTALPVGRSLALPAGGCGEYVGLAEGLGQVRQQGRG